MSDVISVVPKPDALEAFVFTGTHNNFQELHTWAQAHGVSVQLRTLSETYINDGQGRRPEVKVFTNGPKDSGTTLGAPAYLVVKGDKVKALTLKEFDAQYVVDGETFTSDEPIETPEDEPIVIEEPKDEQSDPTETVVEEKPVEVTIESTEDDDEDNESNESKEK